MLLTAQHHSQQRNSETVYQYRSTTTNSEPVYQYRSTTTNSEPVYQYATAPKYCSVWCDVHCVCHQDTPRSNSLLSSP